MLPPLSWLARRATGPSPSRYMSTARGTIKKLPGLSKREENGRGRHVGSVALPSHQLASKCTDPCRKTTFLLERAFLHFDVRRVAKLIVMVCIARLAQGSLLKIRWPELGELGHPQHAALRGERADLRQWAHQGAGTLEDRCRATCSKAQNRFGD